MVSLYVDPPNTPRTGTLLSVCSPWVRLKRMMDLDGIVKGVIIACLLTSLLMVAACEEDAGAADRAALKSATDAVAELPSLSAPSTREGQWRSAKLHGVAWIDSELSEGVDDLPAALKHGTVIQTDGPRVMNPYGDCRAIFIIGQPPMNDVHDTFIYIRTRTTIRVPDRIDGEHVWRFRTVGCAPWRVVDPSQHETPTAYASPELARLHGFAQEFWSGPDYTCTIKDQQGACIAYDTLYTAYVFFAIDLSTRKMTSIELNEMAGYDFGFLDDSAESTEPYTSVQTCVYDDYEEWASAALSHCEDDSVARGVGVKALSLTLAREWPELLDALER